jgi:hypothetical protein
MIDKVLLLLEKRYQATQGVDKTLQYYVKHSFSSDVLDDRPSTNETPKDYCVVCGMPIYSDSPVRFVQYAEELGGRSEIWIPREKGLEEIDKKISQGKKSRGKKSQNDRKKSQNYTVRDSWKVCPICIYEANLMKDEVKPPYFIVTFYPGVPIDLVNIIDFDFSAFAFGEEIEYRVDEKDSYLEAFEKLGGKLAPSEEKVMPAYFSSKVIIKAKDVENKFKLSTS